MIETRKNLFRIGSIFDAIQQYWKKSFHIIQFFCLKISLSGRCNSGALSQS